MKRFKILIHILKATGFIKFVISFIVFMCFSAIVLTLVEPNIIHYGDGLWYAFVTSTTLGYGDFLAITLLGRLVSVVLTIYGLIFFGCLTGVIMNYYTEIRKNK